MRLWLEHLKSSIAGLLKLIVKKAIPDKIISKKAFFFFPSSFCFKNDFFLKLWTIYLTSDLLQNYSTAGNNLQLDFENFQPPVIQ